ncbi:MAG: hypothetical protein LBG48_06185, partial [Rickettsiales bacterium]|nr:hypothetical protein [Rickettsiales bacterium]
LSLTLSLHSCGGLSYLNNSHLSVIAELEFLNSLRSLRNSSSAIQVTMKTKTLELFFVRIARMIYF